MSGQEYLCGAVEGANGLDSWPMQVSHTNRSTNIPETLEPAKTHDDGPVIPPPAQSLINLSTFT